MFTFHVEAETLAELQDKINAASNAEFNKIVGPEPIDNIIGHGIPTPDSSSDDTTESPKEDTPVPSASNSTPVTAKPQLQNDDSGLDCRGLPYDSRIHSASKKKNKDGTWRNRKGIDKSFLYEVEQELKAKRDGDKQEPQTPPDAHVPPAPSTDVMTTLPQVAEQASEAPAPEPVEAPATPTIPKPAVTAEHTYTFEAFHQNLIPIMSSLVNEGKIDNGYVKQLCDYFGINQIYEIFNDEGKVKELYDNFVESRIIKAEQ